MSIQFAHTPFFFFGRMDFTRSFNEFPLASDSASISGFAASVWKSFSSDIMGLFWFGLGFGISQDYRYRGFRFWDFSTHARLVQMDAFQLGTGNRFGKDIG